MEPQENVAIMQRAYQAFNTGDMNTLTELMDETVWHLPGRSSMAGDYQGSGLRDPFKRWVTAVSGSRESAVAWASVPE